MKKLLLVLLSCSVLCSCTKSADQTTCMYKFRKSNGTVAWIEYNDKFSVGDSVEIDNNTIVVFIDKAEK